MVRRPAGRRRLNTIEAHLGQIERIDKHVDRANRVALVNEIIEAFGQQRPLPTIRLFNEAPHQLPPQNHERIIANAAAFSHSQGQKATWRNAGSKSGSPR